MKKENLLIVLNEPESSKDFLNEFLEFLDYDKYNMEIMCLNGEFTSDKENLVIRNFDNSYLDNGFWTGIKKSVKNKKWRYIPILIKENRLKNKCINDRIKYVRLEGKYKACLCLDLESSAYAANNVLAKSKILRFPFGRVEEPYREDFYACKKFSWFVCLHESVKEPFAHTYKINPERVKIIPMVPNMKSFIEKAHKYSIEKNTEYIFTSFCRLASLNQIDFVIDVCKELIKSGFENFKWYVISEREDAVSVKIKIDKEGLGKYIDFLKKQENPYPYLQVCDIYCHVSDIDGEFLSIKQASFLGKPILAIKTSQSENYIKSGETGGISNKNPLEFAKKLIYMTLNKDKFAPVAPEFNTEKIMAEYELLFDRPKKEEIQEKIPNTELIKKR